MRPYLQHISWGSINQAGKAWGLERPRERTCHSSTPRSLLCNSAQLGLFELHSCLCGERRPTLQGCWWDYRRHDYKLWAEHQCPENGNQPVTRHKSQSQASPLSQASWRELLVLSSSRKSVPKVLKLSILWISHSTSLHLSGSLSRGT